MPLLPLSRKGQVSTDVQCKWPVSTDVQCKWLVSTDLQCKSPVSTDVQYKWTVSTDVQCKWPVSKDVQCKWPVSTVCPQLSTSCRKLYVSSWLSNYCHYLVLGLLKVNVGSQATSDALQVSISAGKCYHAQLLLFLLCLFSLPDWGFFGGRKF